ncbi:YfdX family protein [Methylobacterium oryzae CBMB20]
MAVVPLAKTTEEVDQAAKLIADGQYYQANVALKQGRGRRPLRRDRRHSGAEGCGRGQAGCQRHDGQHDGQRGRQHGGQRGQARGPLRGRPRRER